MKCMMITLAIERRIASWLSRRYINNLHTPSCASLLSQPTLLISCARSASHHNARTLHLTPIRPRIFFLSTTITSTSTTRAHTTALQIVVVQLCNLLTKLDLRKHVNDACYSQVLIEAIVWFLAHRGYCRHHQFNCHMTTPSCLGCRPHISSSLSP